MAGYLRLNDSISSLLESNVSAATSEDRLSFMSVWKEYTDEDVQHEKEWGGRHLKRSKPLKLRFANQSPPYMYKNLSVSDLDLVTDDGEGAQNSKNKKSQRSVTKGDDIMTNGNDDAKTNSCLRSLSKAEELDILSDCGGQDRDKRTLTAISNLFYQLPLEDAVGKPGNAPKKQTSLASDFSRDSSTTNWISSSQDSEPSIDFKRNQAAKAAGARLDRLYKHFSEKFSKSWEDDSSPFEYLHATNDDIDNEAVSVSNSLDDISHDTKTLTTAETKIVALPSQDSSSSVMSVKGRLRSGGVDKKRQIPSDKEFELGVLFPCKYVGSMSMPRPGSRNEILAAMRQVRMEYKTRNTKKKKVILEINIDGVKISLDNKVKPESNDKDRVLMEDPIYHIFYVSHDSQDGQVFSYISRRNPALRGIPISAERQLRDKQFHCHVFKAYRRSQASLIVQSLGRIFEVCQNIADKMACTSPSSSEPCCRDQTERCRSEPSERCRSNQSERKRSSQTTTVINRRHSYRKSLDDSVFASGDDIRLPDNTYTRELNEAQKLLKAVSSTSADSEKIYSQINDDYRRSNNQTRPNTLEEELNTSLDKMNLLWQQLEQQEHEIGVVVGQAELLRQQVAIETQYRNDAELRCHKLLHHNKDLLEHINRLDVENRELKRKLEGYNQRQISQPILSSSHTLTPSSRSDNGFVGHSAITSPDSGHKEMSSGATDLLDEWERQNAAILSSSISTNASYQISARCEDDGVTYSIPKKEMENDSLQQITNEKISMSLEDGNSDSAVEDETATNRQEGDNHQLVDYDLSESFSPVLPHRKNPDAATLLRTLMLSDSDKNVSPAKRLSVDEEPVLNTENRSKSLCNSVNSIYDKMKVIRRSLENVECAVSKQLQVFNPIKSGEVTPQSHLPPSGLDADICQKPNSTDQSSSSGKVVMDEKTYEEKSTHALFPKFPLSLYYSNRDTTVESNSMKLIHKYENVSISPKQTAQNKCSSDHEKPRPSSLTRSDTYIIRRHQSDLDISTSLKQSANALQNHRASTSCLNTRYSPQKTTTLSKQVITRSSLTKINQPQDVHKMDTHRPQLHRSGLTNSGRNSKFLNKGDIEHSNPASCITSIPDASPPSNTTPCFNIKSFNKVFPPRASGKTNVSPCRQFTFVPIQHSDIVRNGDSISIDSLESPIFER